MNKIKYYPTKCICGCGRYTIGNSKYHNRNSCKRRYYKLLIFKGELQPSHFSICEECNKKIPRYKQICEKDVKYCEKCRKLKNKIKPKVKNTSQIEKIEIKKIKQEDRIEFCIRNGIECNNYYKWLEFPEFTCVCRDEGYISKIEKR